MKPEIDYEQTRVAPKLHGFALILLSFQSLGVVYSALGTSPLYVRIWPETGPVPSSEDVVGVISAIIWSITLVSLVKYMYISLHFSTYEGEGGTFALFQGLYPPEHIDANSSRILSADEDFNKPFIPHNGHLSRRFYWPLLIWALFGTSLTLADGILTPAVSITSAVSGIGIAKPSISSHIMPISMAIIVAFFLAQRFGTALLSSTYAPVATLWYLLIAGIGIYNITTHPAILRALDPSRAVMLFVRTGEYKLLSGVLLSLTGSEAVFACTGQFNTTSIRLCFLSLVYPGIILCYLGQGARYILDGEAMLSNPFYRSIPGSENGPLYWITFIIALLATIIASQTMVTATFSLVHQVVRMKALPPFRMIHTSEKLQGQMYIPAINWFLMIAAVAVVGGFKDLNKLSNAFGFAVATVFFTTTVLISIQLRYVKRWPWIVAVGFFLIFGFIDGLFWSASLQKVPEGAWVTLMLGVLMMSVMVLWKWGKNLEDMFDRANRRSLRKWIVPSSFPAASPEGSRKPSIERDVAEACTANAEEFQRVPQDNPPAYSCVAQCRIRSGANFEDVVQQLVRIPTCAVFHKVSVGAGVPHTFVGFIQHWPALPRVVIFLSTSTLPIARVPLENRYVITKVEAIEGFYGVTYYVGFRDDLDVQINHIIDQICRFERQNIHDPEATKRRILEIEKSSKIATHIAPHYDVKCRTMAPGTSGRPILNWIRTFLIEDVYKRLAMMFPESSNWSNPTDEIIHVGIRAYV